MAKTVEQLSLVGDSKIVRAANRIRGSSFPARTFIQLKNLVEALESGKTDETTLELRKAKMILKEKERNDNLRKDTARKRREDKKRVRDV